MKVLSSFRTKRDFCNLKEGEVFNLSLFSDICDVDTSISRKILYELYCTAIGEDSAFEVNYTDSTESWRETVCHEVSGVIWLDLMRSDSPQLIINGPIRRELSDWCAKLTDAANKNDRLRISDLFWMTDVTHRVAVFVNGPFVGCLEKIQFEACAQCVSASMDPYKYPWSYGHYIVPGFHAVVSSNFLNRLKDHDKLRSSFSGRLDGYVAKMTIGGCNPVLEGIGNRGGLWEFYLAGKGCWVVNPGCAFIYSSEAEASRAAEAAKPKVIATKDWLAGIKAGVVRALLGTDAQYFNLHHTNTVNVSIMESKQWRNEMFGPSDGINYYAEACRREEE